MKILKKIKEQSNIVFNSPFLKNLSPVERYEFLQLCHKRTYKEGEYVYYRNDPGTGMYFIRDGRVELTLDAPDSENAAAEDKEGFILEAPGSFGALSMGYDIQRESTARCLTDCDLLGFFKPDFEVLRDRNPQIAVKLLETLSELVLRQLKSATEEVEKLSDKKNALRIQFNVYKDYQTEE